MNPLFDQSHEEPKPYVHTNILGPSANTYARRLNYSTIFCVVVLVVAFFGWLLGN